MLERAMAMCLGVNGGGDYGGSYPADVATL
jgi:hypothetical protein